MLTRWHSVAGYALILLCLVGCAGGGGDRSPVEPGTYDESGITASREDSPSGRGRLLLGLWDVALNPDTGRFEAVPLRQTAFHVNVVGQMQEPGSLGIKLLYENYDTGEFHLDVTLNHPFPNSNLRGFDVRGMVFGNLSAKDDPDLLSARDDPDLLWVGPNGFRLLNFDGWARWWNPAEFKTEGLFGYTEGAFGTRNFIAPATLNPYKYFANVLSATDTVVPLVNEDNRGTFATDEGPATRRYELRFPMAGGFPDARFQYAVDASWAPPTGGGSVPGIDDFPPEANCAEAFHIVVDASDSTAFHDEEKGIGGGDLTLHIEVFDWGAPDGGIDAQIETITVQSPTLFDDPWDVQVLSEPGSSNLSGIYSVTIPGVHPTALENQELLVTVISSGSHSYMPPMTGPDYPVGKPLSAYALLTVPINMINPIIVGQITTSGDPVDVETIGNISYVLDDVDGLLIVNVAAPEAPIKLNILQLPFVPVALDVQNGYAYVIDSSGNLQVIDVDPVDGAGIVRTLGLLGSLTSIDVDGLYAYLGNTFGILNIIDISDPEVAFSVNTLSTTGSINDVKVKDGYAYVAADDLEIFNVNPPESAFPVGLLDTSSAARAVDVSDSGYAFVGDSSDQLLVVDVGPPESPAIVEILGLSNLVNDVECSSDLAYLTVSGEGLKIVFFDASSSTAYLIGKLDVSTEAEAISVEGNMAYIDVVDVVLIVQLWEEEAPPSEGWANTWGGGGHDRGYAVATDSSGNVYVAGTFRDTADFDPGGGTDNHTSNGDMDAFLSKFDSSGAFQWALTWGGMTDDAGNGVAADGSGNVYVTGCYSGTVDFDPGGGTDYHASNGSDDIFLSKFDSTGAFQWARTWGSSNVYEQGYGVTVDSSGSVFVTGDFNDTVDFDPGGGTDNHTSNGSHDAFLSKFDSSGTYQWALTWGSTGGDHGYDVAPDGSGHVYVTGGFNGTVDFDPGAGTDNHSSNGGSDAFLSKFDSSGTFEWARTWGGMSTEDGWGVAVEGSQYVYVTGWFWGAVDFDPGPEVDNLAYMGWSDAFLSRFDSTGAYYWAQTWGGSSFDCGSGVAADGLGNACITGYFGDTVDFDPGAGTDNHSSNGSYDAFLSELNPFGTFQWARAWGSTGTDAGNGVAVDGSGNVYCSGYFYDTPDFAPVDPPCNEDPDPHSSNGGYDVFLSKFLPDGCW